MSSDTRWLQRQREAHQPTSVKRRGPKQTICVLKSFFPGALIFFSLSKKFFIWALDGEPVCVIMDPRLVGGATHTEGTIETRAWIKTDSSSVRIFDSALVCWRLDFTPSCFEFDARHELCVFEWLSVPCVYNNKLFLPIVFSEISHTTTMANCQGGDVVLWVSISYTKERGFHPPPHVRVDPFSSKRGVTSISISDIAP